MKNITNLVFAIWIAISCIIAITSCDKHDEPDMPNNTENNSGISSGSDEGNNGNVVQYYFRDVSQVGNIRPTAGSTDISFDCNQPWTVTYSGNISGFSYSPSKGEGRGRVTIRYDEAEYKETSSEITWNESGTLTFHIREGNPQNFRNSTYNVYISRRGSKMKV